MKSIKLYSLISIYFLMVTLVYQFMDQATIQELKHQIIFTILVLFIEVLLLIYVFFLLFKQHIISYSHIFTQVLLIIATLIFIVFHGYHLISMIIITVLLVYLLAHFHEKQARYSDGKMYYHLKIRNNFVISIIYIGYGLFFYGLSLLNNMHLSRFNHIENTITVLFSPYIIIVLTLLRLQYDRSSDVFNTHQRYKMINWKSILTRNVMLNGVSLLIILL